MSLPSRSLAWPVPWEAVQLIAKAEGCRLKAYRCPAGVPTIGWGETNGVRMGQTITQDQADEQFCIRLTECADDVRALVRDADDDELGALVSLAYNIGMANFKKSSVLRLHNAGNQEGAARAFGLWNKAKGQVLRGLTARRAAEAALYLTPDIGEMPQKVDPETSLKESPIAQGGTAVLATGGITAAAEYSGQISTVANNVGISPLWVVVGVLLAVGGVIVYQRYKQRKEGWA
jgi:lysozyme